MSRAPEHSPARAPSEAISERGQGLVEYALILGLMVLICVIALVFFGDQLAAILGFIASQV